MLNQLRCAVSRVVLAACALLGGGTALAQTASGAESAIQEVLVTAQRVTENLQSVPLAVTAFDAESLERGSVESIADIARRTPGFAAGQADPVHPNFAIRGIGSAYGISQNAAGDDSVVVFVDGVYAGRGGTPDIDALDLERIEVLRGPQGTLFGKNAVGGLIQFVSRRPSDQTSLRLAGEVGDYSRRAFSARGNIPLSDRVFLAGGVSIKKRDGYEFNETTGHDVNDEDLTTGHAALRLLPNDDLDIVLAADVTHQDQTGNPRHNICGPTLAGGVHCVGINPDPRVVNAWTDGFLKRDLQTYRAELNWKTPFGMLTSITGYRRASLDLQTPFFSNPINPPAQIESTETDRERNKQFSEEVRLAFGAPDGKLQGQVGVYYLHEDNNRIENLNQQFPIPAISGVADFPQAVTAKSTAVFGQFDYAIMSTVKATVGARETWESKAGTFGGHKVSGPGEPPPLSGDYDVSPEKSWKAFTPRAALDWQAAQSALLYVSATRGFKSGGFQGIAGNSASQATPYDPEYAWSYEAGGKTQWLDNRLRLNLSAFQTNYTDLQISQLIPLVGVVISNAATARIRGAELEFVTRPFPGFQLDGNYAFLDARFTNYPNGPTGNFSGNYLPRSPRNKGALGVQYSYPIGGWQALGRVDYQNQSYMYFEATNIATQKQRGYINLDARVSLTSPNDRWELTVWGKNLTNELVQTYVTAFAPFGQVLVPYAPPRTYGVSLTFRM